MSSKKAFVAGGFSCLLLIITMISGAVIVSNNSKALAANRQEHIPLSQHSTFKMELAFDESTGVFRYYDKTTGINCYKSSDQDPLSCVRN